jgi:hypothetical protein
MTSRDLGWSELQQRFRICPAAHAKMRGDGISIAEFRR